MPLSPKVFCAAVAYFRWRTFWRTLEGRLRCGRAGPADVGCCVTNRVLGEPEMDACSSLWIHQVLGLRPPRPTAFPSYVAIPHKCIKKDLLYKCDPRRLWRLNKFRAESSGERNSRGAVQERRLCLHSPVLVYYCCVSLCDIDTYESMWVPTLGENHGNVILM